MEIRAPVLHAFNQPQRIEPIEVRPPRQGEVLVRMAASGVCHSCLHAAEGAWPWVPTPIILGDEGAGTVVEVGPGVADLKAGDGVVLSWMPACGRCRFCAVGRPVLCLDRPPRGSLRDGDTCFRLGETKVYQYGTVASFSPYVVVPEACAIPLKPGISLTTASLIGCSVMTGVGAVINTAKVPPGASLAVFGCGGVGLNAVQGGAISSANPLIAVDVHDLKLEVAQALGATHRLHATRDDVPHRIREITGHGVDYAVVAVGDTRAAQQAWDSLGPGGTCVIVGLPAAGQTLRIDPATLVSPERRLIGSYYGSARPREDFARLADLYLGGRLKIDQLITRTYEVEQVEEAFRDLAAGSLARGVIVF